MDSRFRGGQHLTGALEYVKSYEKFDILSMGSKFLGTPQSVRVILQGTYRTLRFGV